MDDIWNEGQTTEDGPNAPLDDDALLTAEDVAHKLQVPISWVYGCIRGRSRHPLPHLRIGRYVRFEEVAVREYIESSRRGYLSETRKIR